MREDYQELKDRLIKLSDEELVQMMLAPAGDYRQDALEIAKAELKWRGVEIAEPYGGDDLTAGDPLPGFTGPVPEAVPPNRCPVCGGALRAGTLVAEKELTLVFSDNQEERFIRVSACSQCGQLLFTVDFETDVQQ